jgi:hypothetical protein
MKPLLEICDDGHSMREEWGRAGERIKWECPGTTKSGIHVLSIFFPLFP